MAMDGLALCAITQELQKLVGGKIDKIQQPEKDMLLFTVRAPGETMRLLLCSHAENGRVQFTRQAYENPENAPAFCMLLRRRLIGGRILAARQAENLERILYLEIAARDELQDVVALTFVIELMGKHANMLLLDAEQRIIDCIRRVSAANTSDAARILLPGFGYLPSPAQDKRALLEASKTELAILLEMDEPARKLSEMYSGLSRQSAKALIGLCPHADALFAMLKRFNAGDFSPSLTEQGILPFAPGCESENYPNMSEAYDAFFEARDRQVHMQRHSSSLRRVSEQALKRARNRQNVYFDAMQNSASSELSRLSGEWILANLHRIRPGETQVIVENYYADPPATVTVTLDPRLSANENAQKYFKQYKKAKTAHAFAEAQMAAVAEEISYLEGQLQNIAMAETIAELDEIREELVGERYIRPDKKPVKKTPRHAATEPLHFISSDGITILVGKNNRQNERLTLRDAKPDNLFLHVKNMPGSHVIIDYSGEPPEATLREAAMLAAYYSAARLSGSVSVDYTERRHVKKPAGARAGLVVYATNRTIYVTPEASLVASLKR